MGKWGTFLRERTKQQQMLDEVNALNRVPVWGFVLLLALFIGANIMVRLSSTSEGVLFLFGRPIPHRMLTGAFSSICNLSILLLVALYRKPGYIASMIVLVVQFPSIVVSFIHGDVSTVSGLFTNLLIIFAASLLYTFVSRSQTYLAKMRKQASIDRLTGIANRFAVMELMNHLVKTNEPFAFVVFKFNNYNNISRALGQKAGDEALVQIAGRLRIISEAGTSGTKDFVATRKGNDFLILIRDFSSEEQVRRTIDFYADALKEKFIVEDFDFVLTTSMGYSMFPGDANDAQLVFDYAYLALEHARKEAHEARICRFSTDMLEKDREVELERTIRYAMDNGKLFFNLQPQYDVSHKLRGFEALARLRDQLGNVVSPTDFIPVAEKAGLVDKIDHEVMFSATKYVGELVKKTKSKIILSVNASVRHLLRTGFVDEVKAALKESGLPANQLEIEITESIMIESVDKAIDCIKQIGALGVRIAIDDFGTGYSSLSYLNTFPADVVKIDRSFITTMNSTETSKQYVAAIIAIGHVMNFKVVAEGVEEEDQVETLKKIGCDYIQGFIWGRPMDPDDAAKLVSGK